MMFTVYMHLSVYLFIHQAVKSWCISMYVSGCPYVCITINSNGIHVPGCLSVCVYSSAFINKLCLLYVYDMTVYMTGPATIILMGTKTGEVE